MTNPDEALQPARDRLATAVAALIDPQRVTLPEGRTTWLDSVYQQLADACYEKHSLGGGTAQPAAPLFIDAADCRSDIDHTVRVEEPDQPPFDAHSDAQGRLRHITVARLQWIDARTWRPQDVPHIVRFAADLERLTIRARNLLTPPVNWYLPNPCPLCGKSIIYVDNSGDRVRRPALQLTTDWCRCGNEECDGWWGKEKFRFLGELLGYARPQGVLD